MKRFLKHEYLLIAFGVILFVVLNHFSAILGVIGSLLAMLIPVIAGFILAFILNVPMRGFENIIGRIFKNAKHRPGIKLTRFLSLILTLAVLSAVVALAVMLVVPLLTSSAQNIYKNFTLQLPRFTDILSKMGFETGSIVEWVNSHADISSVLKEYAVPAVKSVFSLATNVVSGAVSVFMIVFIAIYALLSKDTLVSQSKKICKALFKETTCEKLFYAGNLLNFKYYKYLSGQFFEACILGVLGFSVLALFGVPNAFVIAFITAVLAFVPYVGAVTAFGIGAILTIISAPDMIVTYMLIYFVVQIVETQFICPHVVGNAVGLSPLWTLVAVFVGGSLFGLFGMVMFIPLFSVGVTIMHEYLDKKVDAKPSVDNSSAESSDENTVNDENAN